MDTVTPEQRSEIMSHIRSKNTSIELAIRSMLHRLGFRFRLHRHDLPGNPDIVLSQYKTVVFVHGCFWHRHENCKRATTPKSRLDFWLPKFSRTVQRDQMNQEELRKLGWNVMIIWECEIKSSDSLITKLVDALRLPPVFTPGFTTAMSVSEERAEYGEGTTQTVDDAPTDKKKETSCEDVS